MRVLLDLFVRELAKEFHARADAFSDSVSGGGLDGDREFKDAAIVMGSVFRTLASGIENAWKRVPR